MPQTKSPRPHFLLRPLSLKLMSILALCFLAWLIYLDAQVRYKFEGKRWSLPAEVYARSLEIYQGKALNLNNLLIELKLLGFNKVSKVSSPGDFFINGNSVELYSRPHDNPDGPQKAVHVKFSLVDDVVQNLFSFDHSTDNIFSLSPFKIGGIYPRLKEERDLLPYQDFPPKLIAALLVTEDRNFKHHIGIAPLSILRAMWANIRAGKVVQGGSTLTQQLVKNFYLSRERSITRKINEALMSLMLEFHYDKQSILETYMNDVFLGQEGSLAIHGFSAASWFYFGKALNECDLEQYALLVAMIKGPSYFNPRRHPLHAVKRRNLVLALLEKEKMISPSEFERLKARPLNLVTKTKRHENRYPAFMDLVKRQLHQDYDDEDLRTEGLKIYTSLDPQIQVQLERTIASKIPFLEKKKHTHHLQVGAVVTSTGTGEVVAIQGDKQARYNGFNRALDAQRPIGSLIKPAVYLTALSQPSRYNLATPLVDEAFRVEFKNGQKWEPQNFDLKTRGKIPLYQALANSYNLPSARLGLDLGIQAVHETLRKLGINKTLNPYPSLFLGAQSLSPFEVSQMYQTIASNGFKMPLRVIREVTDAHNKSLSRYPVKITQVFTPESIYLLQYALQETMHSGTGKSAYRQLPKTLKVAGKTGTTNDNRDSWFAGFSGDYLTVVWLGRDDNTPTPFTGGTGALQIWTSFIKKIPQYPIAMEQPAEIHYDWFDQNSGKRTDEQCNEALPLPIWGSDKSIEYQACQKGYSSINGWFKSWF